MTAWRIFDEYHEDNAAFPKGSRSIHVSVYDDGSMEFYDENDEILCGVSMEFIESLRRKYYEHPAGVPVRKDENATESGDWTRYYNDHGTVSVGPCVEHHFAWSGKMPCTGIRRCIYCGKPKED